MARGPLLSNRSISWNLHSRTGFSDLNTFTCALGHVPVPAGGKCYRHRRVLAEAGVTSPSTSYSPRQLASPFEERAMLSSQSRPVIEATLPVVGEHIQAIAKRF